MKTAVETWFRLWIVVSCIVWLLLVDSGITEKPGTLTKKRLLLRYEGVTPRSVALSRCYTNLNGECVTTTLLHTPDTKRADVHVNSDLSLSSDERSLNEISGEHIRSIKHGDSMSSPLHCTGCLIEANRSGKLARDGATDLRAAFTGFQAFSFCHIQVDVARMTCLE